MTLLPTYRRRPEFTTFETIELDDPRHADYAGPAAADDQETGDCAGCGCETCEPGGWELD